MVVGMWCIAITPTITYNKPFIPSHICTMPTPHPHTSHHTHMHAHNAHMHKDTHDTLPPPDYSLLQCLQSLLLSVCTNHLQEPSLRPPSSLSHREESHSGLGTPAQRASSPAHWRTGQQTPHNTVQHTHAHTCAHTHTHTWW